MRPELQAFKDKVKASISDKVLPESILKTDVSSRFDDLADLIEWAIATVLGVEERLFQADGSYVIPVGVILEKVAIVPTGEILLRIGTSPGTDDIQPDEVLPAGQAHVSIIERYATNASKSIFFTGITSDTTIRFYKR